MSSGGLPTSPFEVEATKDIIQKHIDAGDIKQSDLDLLKRTYRWMSISSVVGSAGMGVPTYLYLRNARPIRPIGVRMMVAGGMGMIGSFLGFTAGGVAAAMEMKIFHDIALEARQATIDRATGVGAGATPGSGPATGANGRSQRPISAPVRPLPSSSSSSTSPYGDSADTQAMGVQTAASSWQSEAALDNQEMAQESLRSASAGGSPSGSPMKGERDAGANAWDRLRKEAFPAKSAQGQAQDRQVPRVRSGTNAMGLGDGVDSAERRREQAEFDALLEKERQGGGGDKWA